VIDRPLPPLEELRGERAVLRRIRAADAAHFAEGVNDPDVQKFSGIPLTHTEDTARQAIEEVFPERWRTGEGGHLAIADPETDELLGSVLLFHLEWPDARAECGFWLRAAGRGRGAASDAVRMATAWGFAEVGLMRIEAFTDVDNFGSQRVLERTGFEREGLLRSYAAREDVGRIDAFVYGLLGV
jgi:RimJ/RimL family protein N-acetyltransferase